MFRKQQYQCNTVYLNQWLTIRLCVSAHFIRSPVSVAHLDWTLIASIESCRLLNGETRHIINSWITWGVDTDVCRPRSQKETSMCSHHSPSGPLQQERLSHQVLTCSALLRRPTVKSFTITSSERWLHLQLCASARWQSVYETNGEAFFKELPLPTPLQVLQELLYLLLLSLYQCWKHHKNPEATCSLDFVHLQSSQLWSIALMLFPE